MNNKKILALILAFAMMFSSITVAFADTTATIGADAAALKNMGVMLGDDGGVTEAYLAKETTRMQAAIMYLRLKGLEDEAKAFTGTVNFADANTMTWSEGKAMMAYLKANPQLGWVGADAGKFEPFATITVNQYYKVMLEALGYNQGTDFEWTNVMTFAASKNLVKIANATKVTNNDVAVATIEALKTNVKAEAKTLATVMVDAGMINKAAAIAAGLYVEVPTTVNGTIDSVTAIGNTVVEVVFEDDVDAAAAGNKANYAIEGLTINAAVVTGSDSVRLETAAMTAGKLYTMTMGTETVKFSGIAKVSDGPMITDVVSEDVEEVVITFDKNLDFATATNVANYAITGVEIVKAEVDENEVTLTTDGIVNRTKYTVKATNLKSIDGVTKKTTSDSFTANVDKVAPKLEGEIEVQTNERIVVTFNEKITEESAENLANYTIKVDDTDGADLDIISVTWDSDDENNVEIVTEPMEKREDYKLSVINIADQRKVANVMTRPATKVYEAIAADEEAPEFDSLTVLSPTTILVELSDDSKIDEASATDLNNYALEGLEIESIETIKNEWKVFRALLTVEEMETGKTYDLTISDITDEFGNAMDETKESVKAVAGSFASAKLSTAVATGENKILLTFIGEVDEATAENIANYTIDESVGAPTKATLKTDTTVELEVNDLVNGYDQYDIIVDGVEDLAGNELYYKMKVNTATKWDTTAPKLEDAEVLNKYVVALTFDERVDYEVGTKLVLDVDGTEIELVANEVVEDGTVVEFAYSEALDANKTYSVVGVVYGAGNEDGAVRDLVDNMFLSTTIVAGEFEFEGTTDEPEAAEVVSYEQVNGTDIEVTMSRNVALQGGNTVTTNGVTFTVSVDDEVVTFAGDKALTEDDEYTFNFATLLEDMHGFAVANSDSDTETILTAEDTDTINPEIESVVAKNRETIKITFSENIPAGQVQATDFELKNYDLDSSITINALVVDTTPGDKVIELTLAKPMEARYEYELTLKANTIADFVNLKNEAATFYFNGTNLAK